MRKKSVSASISDAGTTDATAKTGSTVVYCGPTIRNVVKSFTAYTDGIPSTLERLAKDCPAINNLIVPTNKLAEVRRELQQNSSPRRIFYDRVTEFLKGGK